MDRFIRRVCNEVYYRIVVMVRVGDDFLRFTGYHVAGTIIVAFRGYDCIARDGKMAHNKVMLSYGT